jgi:hypothetical protein
MEVLTMHEAETIRELMAAYDERRSAWITEHGSDRGFDRWFTDQVCERKKLSKRVLGLLELAAKYLEHPDVVTMPFALNSKVVAKRIRKIMEVQR